MSKDLNKTFEDLLKRYIIAIEKNYHSRFKRAKDKEFIKDELKKGTDFFIRFTEIETEKLLKVFSAWYKRGENMNKIIAHLKDVFGNEEDVLPFKKIDETGKEITLYLSEEDKALKKLALDERKLMKFLIRDTAYRTIQKKLPTMFEEEAPTAKTKQDTPLHWTSPKDTKNEFVQLVYGLHQAGFINKGKGEIIKITEALAEVFEIDLGKNWQSNHSASIHKAKGNYVPPIFDKIKEAYLKYAEDLVEEKKKKK
jgi:hypothetical protein